MCVFGGGAGHITAVDWCVCEHGVSENVMIGWSIVCQPEEWKALYQSSAGVHTQAHATTSPGVSARASPTISKVAFANWKYKHYFSLVEVNCKNVYVTCNLCPGRKSLSVSVASNSNLIKHLTSSHAATQIVAKNADNVSSTTKEGDGAMTSKQLKLDWYIVQYYIESTSC